VLRASKIFKNAQFFSKGTPDSTQIIQGGIGDCWFLSALSAVATAPGLLDQLCVAVSCPFRSSIAPMLSGASVTKPWASTDSFFFEIIVGLMSLLTSAYCSEFPRSFG
jgi:hypothetical protein